MHKHAGAKGKGWAVVAGRAVSPWQVHMTQTRAVGSAATLERNCQRRAEPATARDAEAQPVRVDGAASSAWTGAKALVRYLTTSGESLSEGSPCSQQHGHCWDRPGLWLSPPKCPSSPLCSLRGQRETHRMPGGGPRRLPLASWPPCQAPSSPSDSPEPWPSSSSSSSSSSNC